MNDEVPAAEVPVSAGRPPEIRVLLVDDQLVVAEAMRRMLADAGDLRLSYCRAPQRAVEEAARIGATLILQDLVMPDVDGLTLLRQFRSDPRTRDIPVIVLSSEDDPHTKSEAFAQGANDYVVKLPDQVELIARIRAHSRNFLLQQERDAAYRALREVQIQLERSNAELRRISCQDGLTGIANRRLFDDTLRREWQRARRHQSDLAVFLIDVDHFKAYNDSYGHQGGDDALKQVAVALQDCVERPGDLVARYGGEEFGVILPNTDREGAVALARRFMEAVHRLAIPHRSSPTGSQITVSLGLAHGVPATGPGESPETLLNAADQALYQAKRAGRNCCVVWEPARESEACSTA